MTDAKKILALFGLLISFVVSAGATLISPVTSLKIAPPTYEPSVQRVSLIWDPSPGTNVAGYFMYWGTNSGVYRNKMDVRTNITCTVSNLWEGITYYFVVTAYSVDALESDPSNELVYSVPVSNFQGMFLLFTQTNELTTDLTLRLFSSDRVDTNYTLLAEVPSERWRAWTNEPGTTDQWWRVSVSMLPARRFFRASLSNFWSESDFGGVWTSTPSPLGGQLKLGIRKTK